MGHEEYVVDDLEVIFYLTGGASLGKKFETRSVPSHVCFYPAEVALHDFMRKWKADGWIVIDDRIVRYEEFGTARINHVARKVLA